METTLSDLRWREVISVTDGTRYGFVGDLSVDLETGRVDGLIIPGQARFFGLFGRREERLVRWDSVRKFGEDIILVEGVAESRANRRERKGFLKNF